MHTYQSGDAMVADAATIAGSDKPFGISDMLSGQELCAYRTFPAVTPSPKTMKGPFYEIRTYSLRSASVPATIAAWDRVLADRTNISPLLSVMYAINGNMQHFMHIWPYGSLEERLKLRAEAVDKGVWPPPGGLEHIVEMRSEIFLPAAFSPAQ
jgi:hypothetical protein